MSVHCVGYVVTDRLEGDLPGGQVDLRYQFTLRDRPIARLHRPSGRAAHRAGELLAPAAGPILFLRRLGGGRLERAAQPSPRMRVLRCCPDTAHCH
jgi:hypothetical protein